MKLSSSEMLKRLGMGESIMSVGIDAGLTETEFNAWWQAECATRAPAVQRERKATIANNVEIVRDAWGIPHIFAQNDDDLFFGYGFAMAQDRLWQLDYLRRRGAGRLAEILGAEGLELDVSARTVGLNRIAAREVEALPAETTRLLEAFTRGVNAVIEESRDALPIEFALLDYAPEAWSPIDSIVIWGEFRYYLTVRLPIIVLPELAKRALNDDALYRAFLTPEAGNENIVPQGFYPAHPVGVEGVGETVGDPEEGVGSNNWVVDGKHAVAGMPMVASDPHIAFGATGCWYEAHLCGGSFNVTGTGYVGVPGLIFGRTERVAWGITNNICSQRDLYQEQTDPAHPACFLYDGQWEQARTVTETIHIKGGQSVHKTIRYSRNGPIVDELLPAPARHTGPVSLRWLGMTLCDELTPMWAMNRARTADEFRTAVSGWRVPTWSAVFADVDGHISYQAIGRIPIRQNWERGYREGWNPAHQWHELVPFEGMPAMTDPAHGWIRTANNRTVPSDYPYPLSGTWSSGHRALRIRQMLEAQEQFAFADFARMQQDVLSLRAVEGVPLLIAALSDVHDERVQRALVHLKAWDCRMETDRVGATMFDSFFKHWSETVARERFNVSMVSLMASAIGGLALELLANDRHGWFTQTMRRDALLLAFNQMLDELTATRKLGADMARWQWGHTHKLALRHTLSGRGDLGQLLDRGGMPVRGNGLTVCNTSYDPNYMASMGANYRLIADLSVSPPTLHAVDAAGESGHPGSAHYGDQTDDWLNGRYHALPLERAAVQAKNKLVLQAS
jgi:penicillin amidase